MFSHEIIEFINVVLADVEEVEARVSAFVVVHRPDQPLELVDVEGLRTKHVVIQGVNHLLVQKVEQLVPIKVNVVSSIILEKLRVFECHMVGQVLAIVDGPLFFVNFLVS